MNAIAGTLAPEKIKTGRDADSRILTGFYRPCYQVRGWFSGWLPSRVLTCTG